MKNKELVNKYINDLKKCIQTDIDDYDSDYSQADYIKDKIDSAVQKVVSEKALDVLEKVLGGVKDMESYINKEGEGE